MIGNDTVFDAFSWSGCNSQWFCEPEKTAMALLHFRHSWSLFRGFDYYTRLRLPVKLRLLTSCKGQLPQTHGENEWHPKHLETPKTNSDLLLSLSK